MKELLLSREGRPAGRRADVIHPSEMAKADWCHRATYYRMTGRKDMAGTFSFTLQNIFAEGNAIHAKWQDWLRATGQLWGSWECLVCLMTFHGHPEPAHDHVWPCTGGLTNHIWEYREVDLLNHELQIYGKEDGALLASNTLVEFKSVGLGTLRFESPGLLSRHYNTSTKQYDLDAIWRGIDKPFPSHVRQTQVYLWLAHAMGLPFDKVSIVYEYKVNQQVREYVMPYTPDIIEPLLAKAREIKVALASSIPPACSFGGCKNCRSYEESPEVPGQGGPADRGDRPAPRVVLRGRGRDDRGRLHAAGQAADRDGENPAGLEGRKEGTGG